MNKVCANVHGTIWRQLNEFQIRGNKGSSGDLMSMRGSLLVLQKSDAADNKKTVVNKTFLRKRFPIALSYDALGCVSVKKYFRVCKNYIREYVSWRETLLDSILRVRVLTVRAIVISETTRINNKRKNISPSSQPAAGTR